MKTPDLPPKILDKDPSSHAVKTQTKISAEER